MAKMT